MKTFNFVITEQENRFDGTVESMPAKTIAYAKCVFDISGSGWDDVENIFAIFSNKSSGEERSMDITLTRECNVPHEVLYDSGTIQVNLVGFNAEDVQSESVTTYRITSFATKFTKQIDVLVEADSEASVTPTMYEQYIARVQSEVAKVTGMSVSATTLPAGADASVTKSTGEQGEVYLIFGLPRGAKGDKGDTGATGATGPQGATGATGPQGEKGDKGDTGSQGPKGDTGDTGATGPQGPQGIQGPTGATGSQGPQGIQGPKGDDGEDGSVVTVSASGTSTNEVQYITIDDTEYKLAGGGGGTDLDLSIVDGKLCVTYEEE